MPSPWAAVPGVCSPADTQAGLSLTPGCRGSRRGRGGGGRAQGASGRPVRSEPSSPAEAPPPRPPCQAGAVGHLLLHADGGSAAAEGPGGLRAREVLPGWAEPTGVCTGASESGLGRSGLGEERVWLRQVQNWPQQRVLSPSLTTLIGPPPCPLQGSPPAGGCAGPPVPGCAAGGPPPESLGRPGYRHWGGAAAARWVLLPLARPRRKPGPALRGQALQKRGPSPRHPAGEEKGKAKPKPPKLRGTSCAVVGKQLCC